MIKHVIAIYPGRFQPFGKHHAAAFKWLQQQFGQDSAFIVTSDKVDPPKSPFNFEEKKQIVSHYGFNNIIQVKNPYKAEELMNNYNPEDTAVVFMVGEKDMKEDPRFKIGTKKDGSPSYFQSYKDNKGNLQGFDKHGYLITAPHVSIAIPGYGEMSGTELRNVLGTKTVSRDEKAKIFKDVFGWYDKKTADMIFDKLEPLTESVFSKDWWKQVFESLDPKTKNSLTEENIFTQIKSKFKDFIKKLKQEGDETKQAFVKLAKAAKGDITLSDKDKTEIGEQLKDTLRLAGLTAIAIAPGGVIVGALLKLLKQEHLVTPSAFVNELSTHYQNALSQTEKEALKITYKSWDKFGGKECNNGFCDIFARNLSKYLPGSKIMNTEDPRNNTLGHVWIEYKGKYYDAETPNGVNSWKQLPWMKEFYSKNKSYPTDIENLNEVGEANLKPYKWKETDREGYYVYIKFKTDSGTKYEVDLKTTSYVDDDLNNIKALGIEFGAEVKDLSGISYGTSVNVIVNEGDLYRVMATVGDIIKHYIKKFKAQAIMYLPSKKTGEDFGSQRDKLYKAFIKKAIPGIKFEQNKEVIVAILPNTAVREGYMGAEQTKKHNAKLAKLKQFLDANVGREFVYDFDMYPKTVVGVGLQEGILKEGGAAGHMAHPFNIDWVKNGKDLLEVFKMATEYLKNGPGAVKIDGLNASIRLIELDGKKQFVLDRGSQKDLDVRGITKADLLDRFGEGHGMIQVGGKVLDIFNASLSATTQELKQLGLWNDPNLMFNLEYVSGTSNVIDYGNNFLAIHGLLEITRQTNAKTGKPGARVTKEVDYNEDVMQRYIDKLAVFAQKQGYEVVGSVPTEMKSEPNFTKVLSEKITINYGNGKEETKPMSQWLSMIKVPENETIKLADGKSVNALSKAVLNAVLAGTPLNEFVADEKDIPLAIDGAITYLATAKLGDEVLKNLESKLGPVSDHEGVVIRDERIYAKPFKLTGQFIITGQTSQFQKNQ